MSGFAFPRELINYLYIKLINLLFLDNNFPTANARRPAKGCKVAHFCLVYFERKNEIRNNPSNFFQIAIATFKNPLTHPLYSPTNFSPKNSDESFRSEFFVSWGLQT